MGFIAAVSSCVCPTMTANEGASCNRISSHSWLCPQVAVAFTKRDPIRTHARDELGIDVDELANPLQVLPTEPGPA